MENEAGELWLQTSIGRTEAHLVYEALGFEDKAPPAGMKLNELTKKTMCLEL